MRDLTIQEVCDLFKRLKEEGYTLQEIEEMIDNGTI